MADVEEASGVGDEAGDQTPTTTVGQRMRQAQRTMSQSVEGAVGRGVGNVKESAGKLKDRVSKPRMVDLKGTSGYDLLLDTDGRRSADPETLFTIDRETHVRIRRVTEGLTSSLQVLANEPSLGLYRMEEHVLKAVPELVRTKQEIVKLTAIVQGACHDVEYALTTVQQMHQISSFESLQAHTEKAIQYQQNIRRMHQAAAVARQKKRQAAASPDLIEPTGAFSSSLRTGMTPTEDARDDTLLTTDDGNVPTRKAGADMAAATASGADADADLAPPGFAPAEAGGDESLVSPRKKKKKKKKEIVTKSF